MTIVVTHSLWSKPEDSPGQGLLDDLMEHLISRMVARWLSLVTYILGPRLG